MSAKVLLNWSTKFSTFSAGSVTSELDMMSFLKEAMSISLIFLKLIIFFIAEGFITFSWKVIGKWSENTPGWTCNFKGICSDERVLTKSNI